MARTLDFSRHHELLLLICCALTSTSYAGLSRAPSSHIEPTADGRHILVYLAPLRPIEEGNVTEEEHNRTSRLNTKYPASGCYEIGSTTPLWTAPWDDRDGWSVSDDCRYLVRWNVFGDGGYRRGGERTWGLKFYDYGKEIKSHDVAELMDFPSLMPFTSSDWHYDWIGDIHDNCNIQGGQFLFHTSTHERYRFDLATGEIVEQFRMWRKLSRMATAMVFVAVGGVAVMMVRKRKRAVAGQETNEFLAESSRQAAVHHSTRSIRYSVRTLLLITTVVAVLCVTVPRWPHLVLFFSVVSIAIFLTRVASRYRRSSRLVRGSKWPRIGFTWRAAVTVLAWCAVYVLSVGPVIGLADWLRAPVDVRMAIILTIYRPLYWISVHTSHNVFSALEWYFRSWGQ